MKKCCLILFLIYLSGIKLLAQLPIKDSILSLLVHDTVKINLFYDFSQKIYDKNNSLSTYYLESVQNLLEKAGTNDQKIRINNALSLNYLHKGDYSNAFIYGTKAVKLAEESQNIKAIIYTNSTMGSMYGMKNDKKEARKCFLKAVYYCKQINDSKDLANLCFNTSLLFDKVKEKDSVLKYINLAFETYEKDNNQKGIFFVKNSMAEVYMANNEFDKALRFFTEAKMLSMALHEDRSTFIHMNNLGSLYLRMGKPEKSYNEYYNALTLFSHKGFDEIVLATYNNIVEAAIAMKRYDKALEYFKLYIEAKEALFSQESMDNFSELKLGYKQELDKKQIELLKSENTLKENRHKTFLYFILGSGVFILIIGFLTYNRFRLKRKSEEALKLKNKEIEEKNKEILDSIHYARRIQSSLFTPEKYIDKNLNKLIDK